MPQVKSFYFSYFSFILAGGARREEPIRLGPDHPEKKKKEQPAMTQAGGTVGKDPPWPLDRAKLVRAVEGPSHVVS